MKFFKNHKIKTLSFLIIDRFITNNQQVKDTPTRQLTEAQETSFGGGRQNFGLHFGQTRKLTRRFSQIDFSL